MTNRFDDLLRFTETYKMLLIPYLKIEQPTAYNIIYSKKVSRSIINVFPAWKSVDATVEHGFVYLVLRRSLLDEGDEEGFGALIRLDIVEDYWMEDDLVILALHIPKELATRFFLGEYSKMFDKLKLMKIWQLFKQQEGGILTPVPAGVKSAKLSKEYHILTKSRHYEKIIAAQLGVPFSEFEGQLPELKSRLLDDIVSETLDVNLLMKQLIANGNT